MSSSNLSRQGDSVISPDSSKGDAVKVMRVMCRYYPKALCLRDDDGACESCPYYKLYLRENSGSR